MTSYSQNSLKISEYNAILYASDTLQEATQSAAVKRSGIDTLAQANTETARKDSTTSPSQRAVLPKPKSNPTPDDLLAVAEAFVKAFDAIDQGLITQTKDYTELQQLNETQSQAILQETSDAITKEMDADKLASKVEKYAKKSAKVEKIFGWVMFSVGLLIVAGTIISAIVSCGATAPALPEEAAGLTEMTAATSASVDSLGDTSAAAENLASDTSSDADTEINADENGGEAPSYMADTQSMMADSSDSVYQDTEETVSRDLDESNADNGKSKAQYAKSVAKTIGKYGLRAVTGAGFGSPMLMKGIYDRKVGAQLEQVKDAQKKIGPAMDIMEENNMYFQWTQQLIQREGSVLQEESNDASEIIETYGDIMNAYKGITFGLANSA